MIDGPEANAPPHPISGREIDMAPAASERADQLQNVVMRQRIQTDCPYPRWYNHRAAYGEMPTAVESWPPPFNHCAMAAPPLTHHDILELAAPFSRRGRHVDLAASDRMQRMLLFKPVDHPGDGPSPATREILTLESLGTGTCRLTRTLTRSGSPPATLTVMGQDPEELLALVETVPPQDQFRAGPGYVIARSYSLEAVKDASAGALPALRPVMTQGVAQVEGLKLTLGVPSTRRVAADLQLTPNPGETLELPEDLLAVLGWDWARMIRNTDGWRSKRRLRGGALARTRTAEAALEKAAAHLAKTLAAPTARFHEEWAAARWGVFFRRGIPVLMILLLLIIIAAIPHKFAQGNPSLFVVGFHIPTLLIALSFCLQELPTYEIPPIPRPAPSPHWRRPLAVSAPV